MNVNIPNIIANNTNLYEMSVFNERQESGFSNRNFLIFFITKKKNRWGIFFCLFVSRFLFEKENLN